MRQRAGLSTAGVATATQTPAVGNPVRSDALGFLSGASCLLSNSIGEMRPGAEWRRRGLYQASIQVNSAIRASPLVLQLRRSINSHSRLASTPSAMALS